MAVAGPHPRRTRSWLDVPIPLPSPGIPARLLAAGYGLAFIYGLFAAGNSDVNFLSINGADNGLHLVSAIAGLAIALWPADRTARANIADRRT